MKKTASLSPASSSSHVFLYVFAEIQTFIAMHIGGIHLRDDDTARQWYEKMGSPEGN
jgi:hypothetical protein